MTKAEEYINSIPKFAGKTELRNTEILLNELGIDTDDIGFTKQGFLNRPDLHIVASLPNI